MPLKRQEAVAEGGSKLNYIAPNRYKHLPLSETFSGIARWLIILDTILLVRLEPAEEQEVCGIQSALQMVEMQRRALAMEDGRGWLTAFLQEILAMPLKHVLVFLVATVLLVIVQVEVIEGWRLIHLLELLGLMLFLYMGWVTWRVARMLRKQGKL